MNNLKLFWDHKSTSERKSNSPDSLTHNNIFNPNATYKVLISEGNEYFKTSLELNTVKHDLESGLQCTYNNSLQRTRMDDDAKTESASYVLFLAYAHSINKVKHKTPTNYNKFSFHNEHITSTNAVSECISDEFDKLFKEFLCDKEENQLHKSIKKDVSLNNPCRAASSSWDYIAFHHTFSKVLSERKIKPKKCTLTDDIYHNFIDALESKCTQNRDHFITTYQATNNLVGTSFFESLNEKLKVHVYLVEDKNNLKNKKLPKRLLHKMNNQASTIEIFDLSDPASLAKLLKLNNEKY